MNKMYEYLKNNAYISYNKKSTYEFELSEERAECIANKYDSLTDESLQKNKKLNGAIQTYDILLKANTEENKRLKDNWNKLKEYCKENTCYEVGDDENTKLIGSKIHGLNVLDKMQELEQGSDSNE